MRRITVLLVALALSACAYPHYVNDEYRYVPLTNFSYENRSYRIFDKPSAGKLVVTPSLSMAVSDNVIRNATFGKYHNATPREAIEAAVAAFLVSNGRRCKIVDGTLIYDPQWEFAYTCEVRVTAYP